MALETPVVKFQETTTGMLGLKRGMKIIGVKGDGDYLVDYGKGRGNTTFESATCTPSCLLLPAHALTGL